MPDQRPDANPLAGGELAAFTAAVEAASVQGADALQLTQSAATKRIHSLERRIGAPLLERGRFGVRPTGLGRTVYPPAKRALEALAEVAEVAEGARAADAVDLRLSASLTIGEFLLPDWLAQFRADHPDVHPQLEVINSRGVLQAIRERRAWIGFVEGVESLAGFDSMVVAHDALVAVVAADHAWAGRRSVSPRDLVSEPYLTRESASGTRAVADVGLAQAGLELTPTLQAASFQTLKRALTGGGFGLMSELTIETERRAGLLVGLPVRGVELTRELRAVRLRRPALTGAARLFWRWLVRHSE